MALQKLPVRLVGRGNCVGFRSTPLAALDSAGVFEPHTAAFEPASTHLVLQVEFTAQALADATVTPAGAEYNFAPMLHKVVYLSDRETDWGVWHFCGDFPLGPLVFGTAGCLWSEQVTPGPRVCPDA